MLLLMSLAYVMQNSDSIYNCYRMREKKLSEEKSLPLYRIMFPSLNCSYQHTFYVQTEHAQCLMLDCHLPFDCL